jgi:hypothetical protein
MIKKNELFLKNMIIMILNLNHDKYQKAIEQFNQVILMFFLLVLILV